MILAAARMRGFGTVATIHGADFLAFARRHPRLVFGVLRRAHLVTCLDPQIYELLSDRLGLGTVELLPNPVKMDTGSRDADATQEVVLFAGEVSLRKGADVLVEAWPSVSRARPEAMCLMVGPPGGVEVPGLERIEVRAPVDAAEMRDLLRSARVVVLPSRAEGMPMILTEALGAGRPFISTPVGGIPELARSGGVLVPVGDSDKLAENMIEMLKNPELAKTIGDEGRAYCAATRSAEVIDQRLRKLYEKVLDCRRG